MIFTSDELNFIQLLNYTSNGSLPQATPNGWLLQHTMTSWSLKQNKMEDILLTASLERI